jgi:hypothetical protein
MTKARRIIKVKKLMQRRWGCRTSFFSIGQDKESKDSMALLVIHLWGDYF